MPVMRWEIVALAQMLISTHGDAAEDYAISKMQESDASANSGQRLIWKMALDEIRGKAGPPETEPI